MVIVYLGWVAIGERERGDPTCEMQVVVEVLNGCGVRGMGERVSEALRDRGLDVMFVGNADDFRYAETLVIDRSGDRSKVREVAKALGGPPVVYQVSDASFVDVTVVVGSDISGYSAQGGD